MKLRLKDDKYFAWSYTASIQCVEDIQESFKMQSIQAMQCEVFRNIDIVIIIIKIDDLIFNSEVLKDHCILNQNNTDLNGGSTTSFVNLKNLYKLSEPQISS